MANLPQFKVKRRIISFFIILFLIIFALCIRLIWIQVINGDEYQKKALDQRLRPLKVEPQRGIIYDCNGKELALSASSETVVAIPLEVSNPDLTANKLAKLLNLDVDYISKRLKRKASAVYIKRKIDEKTANKIRDLDLPGIIFTEESKRYYPKDNLASHIMGFAGIDSQGLDGIELSYDKYLKGIPGKIEAERDAAGRIIPGGVQEYIAPKNGFNIYLTIDEVIQYIVERELDRAMQEFSISGGTVIVMDPKSGEILALANRPDYNPNNFVDYPQKYWRNRAISDSFEPGSTFKIITTASVLEAGVVNENDIFVDPGYIIVSGEKINCWKSGGHGRQTFAEVVQNSCNPGFVQVGMRLGKESFYNFINAFGFGNKTGIKLPGESKGLVYEYDKIGPVELATISFGHGITVTPIQLITATAAIANNGMLLKPRLLKRVLKPNGELIEKLEPVPVRQVVSKETAQRTLNLLEKVVSDGTGRNAQIEGYRIGGKTGTAKHYGVQVYDSSFIGIVPIDNPELVILVVLYDVTGFPYYGSQTAAPIFRNIALDTLRYLNIPPKLSRTKNEKINTVKEIVPKLTNLDIFKAEEILRKRGLDVKLVGMKDKVIHQIPLPGAKVIRGSTILLFTDENYNSEKKFYVAVPDLVGLTKEKAQYLLAELGLKLIAEGEGRIIKQDLNPGIRIPGGSVIKVKLKDNG